MNEPKLTPRPDCETCGGTGKIEVPIEENVYLYCIEEIDCPECEEVNDIENEQIEKL